MDTKKMSIVLYVFISVFFCVAGFILLQKDKRVISHFIKSFPLVTQYQAIATPQPIEYNEIATVSAVIDGDTIVLFDKRKVRYIGIDTPELHHPNKQVECFGVEAKEKNKSIVERKTIRMKKDVSNVDRYGRLLRYVWVDTLFVNEYLVAEGYALPAAFPPDVAYSHLFQTRSQEARQKQKGLWKRCY